MNDLIDNITELHKNRFELLAASEKPKVGWVSIYTPEEIIHAAGMIPFRITGETALDTSKADTLLHRNICSYILSCLEEGMAGAYEFMDGFVSVDACIPRRRVFDVWSHYLKPRYTHCLCIPKYENEFYRDYYRKQTALFLDSLKSHFNCEITEDSLLKSIELFNQARQLMQKLYDLRKKSTPILPDSVMRTIIKSGMTGFKEEFITRVAPLVSKLESTETEPLSKKHRVLLCGSFFDHPNLIETIENTGVMVVCEDNSNGVKYFDGEIDINSNPVEAISDYYFHKMTSACLYDTEKRLSYLTRLIKEYNIQSVIYFTLKFCDQNLIDYPFIEQRLKEMKIPVLFVETERHIINIESLKTRISAFFEIKVQSRESV